MNPNQSLSRIPNLKQKSLRFPDNLLEDPYNTEFELYGDSNYKYEIIYKVLEKDTDYTLSFNAEFLEDEAEYISVRPFLNSNESMSTIRMPYTNERMTTTFRTDSLANYDLIVYAGQAGQTMGNGIRFTEAKLELGTEPTPWEPNSEE